jgi:hypothetical protein
MDKARLDDALSSMTKRDLEQLQHEIERRLVTCLICDSEGADAMMVAGLGAAKGKRAVLLLCKPCFEKHRLPESRSET